MSTVEKTSIAVAGGTGLSKYRWQDHLVVDIARYYADLYGQPFMAAIGEFEDYDIISLDGRTRVEIKCEKSSYRTGNVAIEFWNTKYNNSSGILSTTANLWLHIVYDYGKYTAYEWDVDSLRKLCLETGEVKACGDNALCKIIPLETFKAGAIKHFDINFTRIETMEG